MTPPAPAVEGDELSPMSEIKVKEGHYIFFTYNKIENFLGKKGMS